MDVLVVLLYVFHMNIILPSAIMGNYTLFQEYCSCLKLLLSSLSGGSLYVTDENISLFYIYTSFWTQNGTNQITPILRLFT